MLHTVLHTDNTDATHISSTYIHNSNATHTHTIDDTLVVPHTGCNHMSTKAHYIYTFMNETILTHAHHSITNICFVQMLNTHCKVTPKTSTMSYYAPVMSHVRCLHTQIEAMPHTLSVSTSGSRTPFQHSRQNTFRQPTAPVSLHLLTWGAICRPATSHTHTTRNTHPHTPTHTSTHCYTHTHTHTFETMPLFFLSEKLKQCSWVFLTVFLSMWLQKAAGGCMEHLSI